MYSTNGSRYFGSVQSQVFPAAHINASIQGSRASYLIPFQRLTQKRFKSSLLLCIYLYK